MSEMRALCWNGIGDLVVTRVPQPETINADDIVVKVHLSATCGSDLHFINGYIPTLRRGDIIGHEFIGEVVEKGPNVKKLKIGDRVVVPSTIGCGACHHCRSEKWSLCDNSNPNESISEILYGSASGAVYGCSHAFGGYAGSHAEYVRVPYADHGAIRVPDEVSDEKALFVSDACPTGYMAAEMCSIQPGDVVAVWGAGAVGLMAAKSAFLLGAERVIVIDRFIDRLKVAEKEVGAETLNYEEVDVHEALKELTAGRLPDACIDAVGLEAHETGLEYLYDRMKQMTYIETDRAVALRQAIHSCRKGGVVSVIGTYGGLIDKFPMGAAFVKGLTIRTGIQNGQKYAPLLLKLIQEGKLDPSFLLTHRLPLSQGPQGYYLFKYKIDGCIRAAFDPRIQ